MAECQQLNSSLGVAASHRSFVSIASRCGGDVRLMTDGSMMTSSSRRRCGGGLGYRAHGGSSEDDDDDDDDCEGDVTSLNLANSGNGGVEISTPNGLWVTLNKTVLLQLVERICMLSFQQAETASTSSSNQSQFYGRPATAERPNESGAEFAYSPSTTKQRSSPSAGTSKQSRNDKTCGTASPDLPETDVIESGVRPSVDAAAAATNGNGTMAAKQGRRSSSVSKVKQSHQSNSAAAAPTTNACRDGGDCTTAETVVDDSNKQHGGDAVADVVAGTETSSARDSSRMRSEDQEMLPSESSVSDQKAIHTRSIRKRRLLKASVGQNIRVRTKNNPDVDEKQLKRIDTSGSDSSRSGAGSDDMSTAAETDMETAAAKENTATDTTANRLHDDDRHGLDVVNSRSSSSSTRRLRHSAAVAKLRRSQRCNRRRLQLIKQQLASGELPLRSDNGIGSGSGGGSRPPAAAWSSQQQQQQHQQQQQQQLAESRRRQKQSWLALNKSIFYCALDRALTAGGNNDGGAGVEGNNARRASAPARANTTSTTRAAKSIWNPATSVSKYETAAASTAAEATSSQQQPPLFSPTGIQNPGSGVCQLLPVGMWSGSSDIASPSAAAVMVSPLWMAAAAASRNAFPFQPPSVAGAATTSAADYGLGSSCANSSLLCALLGFDVGQSVVAETTAALRLQQRQLPTEIPRGPPSTADDSDDVFMPPQPPPQQRQVGEKSDFDADARCGDRQHPPSVGDTPAVRAGSWTHSPPGWWNGNGRNDAEARGGRHSISGDVVAVTEDVHASQRRGDSRPNDESPLDCRTARLQQQQQQQPVKAVIVPSNDGGKSELLRIAGGRVTDKWIVLDKCDVSSLVENLVNTMIVSTTSSSGPGGSASAEQRQLSPAAGSGSNQSSSAAASGTVAEPRKWKTNLLQRLQTETQIP